jgi:hypothetical protein
MLLKMAGAFMSFLVFRVLGGVLRITDELMMK